MIHRAQRGVMECEPLSGNAGVSFSSPNGNLTSLTFRSFPYTNGKFSPSLVGLQSEAKVSTEEIVGRFQGSEVSTDNASKAFRDSSLFLALTLKTISTLFRRISLAAVTLASQVCPWIPSAHAHWKFSSFEPKPHLQKFVLEEKECEWKADGIEIELRSDAVGHLICSLQYIVTADDLGFDNRSFCGWYELYSIW